MIKFGVREALEMFEMLRDSACMVDHFTDYISHSQDPQLRQILENQQRRMVESYQQKVGVIQGHGIDLANIPKIQSVAGVQGTWGVAGVQGTAGMAGVQGTAGMAGVQGAAGMAGAQGAAGMAGAYGTNIQFGIPQAGAQTQAQSQQHFQAQSQQNLQQQQAARTLNDRTISQGALLFHKCGASRATTAALESAEPHLRNLAANSARACLDMAYEIFSYMQQKGYYQLPEMPRNFVSHMQTAGTQGHPGMQPGYHGVQGVQGQLS